MGLGSLTETCFRYDGYNQAIYDLVPSRKRILDVGCATGRLGEKLVKEKYCYVVGVEVDPEMAKVARGKCNEVIEADVENTNELDLLPQSFDIIIFADSLEHMKNPAAVLSRMKRYLSKQGTLLISIPNVAFFSSRLGLLFGKFDYAEYGVLDKSHLRFFTLKTARKLLEDNGFQLISVSGYSAVRNRFYIVRKLANVWKVMFAADFIMLAKNSANDKSVGPDKDVSPKNKWRPPPLDEHATKSQTAMLPCQEW